MDRLPRPESARPVQAPGNSGFAECLRWKRTPLDAPFGAVVDDVDLATLSQADADRLSDWLLDSAWLLFRRQSLTEAHLYRHRWRPGDVVLSDNGQTLHRREAFQGLRLMKSTRVFLPPDRFPVPD